MKNKVLSLALIFIVMFSTAAFGLNENIISAVFQAFGVNVDWDEKNEDVLASDNSSNNDLKIHFIDVGQADSILIELPNEEEVLIDAGNNGDEDTIINYLRNLNIDDIEYLVLTHPHEDHIGGAADVIEAFDIGKVYMPDKSTSSKTYADTINAIKEKNIEMIKAEGGLGIINEYNLKYEVLAPNSMFYSELNEYSLVTKLTYENTSYLFTGDAESVSELEMMRAGYDLDVDLLKVGHHGGRTSSSRDFLNIATPEYAIISSGSGNKYGHPHQETLDRLSNIGAKIYRTDEQGTIVAASDGNKITINFDGN